MGEEIEPSNGICSKVAKVCGGIAGLGIAGKYAYDKFGPTKPPVQDGSGGVSPVLLGLAGAIAANEYIGGKYSVRGYLGAKKTKEQLLAEIKALRQQNIDEIERIRKQIEEIKQTTKIIQKT